jgi:hypothetical protein
MPWVKSREYTEAAIRLELTWIALAFGAYRSEHGRYPASLDELMPKYLDRVATDPCGSGPYLYRRMDEGFLLYSVGVDGVDDTGPRPASVGVSPDPPALADSDDVGIRIPDRSDE